VAFTTNTGLLWLWLSFCDKLEIEQEE